MTRLGILGGTFDPVHMGHLVIAEEARAVLGLDGVLLMPARQPPHKLDVAGTMTAPLHRVAMLERAVAGNPAFAVSRVDLDRPGPHFTVDTLALLAEAHGPGAELFFIMGGDSLVDLPTWHRPADIIRRAHLAVAGRPGYAPDIVELERVLPGIGDAVTFVPTPPIGVSATDLRRRVAEGRPIRYQVPDAVADYIGTHGLYTADGEMPSAALATGTDRA